MGRVQVSGVHACIYVCWQRMCLATPCSASLLLLCCYHICSALEELVQKHHKRHEALVVQIEELQAKLHAVQQQATQPVSAWQAASFLLFFLCFINFWGMIANFQVWGLPWAAAKTSATSLWLKQLLSFVVPMTNTVVVLIFCMQAVKAAWTCLKW